MIAFGVILGSLGTLCLALLLGALERFRDNLKVKKRSRERREAFIDRMLSKLNREQTLLDNIPNLVTIALDSRLETLENNTQALQQEVVQINNNLITLTEKLIAVMQQNKA